MTKKDQFLEDIRYTELEGYGRSNRWELPPPIKLTSAFQRKKKIPGAPSFAIFKPSYGFKLSFLTFTVGLFAFLVASACSHKTQDKRGLIICFPFSILLLITCIRQFFVDKTMNYSIKIDQSGISIDDTLFEWKNIYATGIMQASGGKGVTRYLLIAMNNKTTYEKFDLTNFVSLNIWGFHTKLARYIEYFKPKTMPPEQVVIPPSSGSSTPPTPQT